MTGYSITIIPKSWAVGRWDKGQKTIWAFGPFRFVLHSKIVGGFGG